MTSVQPLPAPENDFDDEIDDEQFDQNDSEEFDDSSDDESHGDSDDTSDRSSNDTGSSQRQKTRPRSKVTARTVRQIIAKHDEVESAPPSQRKILAAALGVRDDAVEITAHIVQAPRVQLAGFTEIDQVIDVASDPFEAMTKAFQFESAHRSMWAVLAELGVVSGNLPSKESTAATQIAQACTKITDEHRATIENVRTLSRKAA